MEYGIPGCTATDIYEAPWGNGWGNAASGRDPAFEVVLGMGQVGTIPLEKVRASDPQHGQIAATPNPQTRLVATPGAMLVGILMVIACIPTA